MFVLHMNNSQLIRHKFLPQLACYNIFKTYQFKEVELNVLFLKEASEVLNTYKTIQFHNFYKQSKQKTTSCEILNVCKKLNYPNQSTNGSFVSERMRGQAPPNSKDFLLLTPVWRLRLLTAQQILHL